jgi:hypothetical protein
MRRYRCFLVSSEDAWVILKQTKMLQNRHFLDSRIKKIAFGSEDKRRKSRLRVNLSNIYTYHYWGLKKTFPFLFI